MGYLTLHIDLHIQANGKNVEFKLYLTMGLRTKIWKYATRQLKELSDFEPINRENNFFYVVSKERKIEKIFIFRSKMYKYLV